MSAQPPIPEVRPAATLPRPWPTHSLRVEARRPSSTRPSSSCTVSNDSSSPTVPMVTAYGAMMPRKRNGSAVRAPIAGMPNLGSTETPPAKVSAPAMSTSVVAGSRSSLVAAVTMPTASRLGGSAVVSLGMSLTSAIVATVSAAMVRPRAPRSRPPVSGSRKCVSCARVMTIARPLTNPSITGCGTSRMNLPRPSAPHAIWYSPAKSAAAERYAGPCAATSEVITTAHAPDAPVIEPRPAPKAAAKKPMTTVVHSPTIGETPATKAKATASGIMARLTVKPESTLDTNARPPLG